MFCLLTSELPISHSQLRHSNPQPSNVRSLSLRLISGLTSGWLGGDQFERVYQQMLDRGGGISASSETSARWMNGISQTRYNDYRLEKKLPAQDVLLIQTGEVREIYRQVWAQAQCDALASQDAIACLEGALQTKGDRLISQSRPSASQAESFQELPSELPADIPDPAHQSGDESGSGSHRMAAATDHQSARPPELSSHHIDESANRAVSPPFDSPISSEGTSSEGFSSEAIAYLLDIALGVEYGNAEPVIRKWQREIRIQVHGTPTPEDEHTLNQVVHELRDLTGLSLRFDQTNPNVTIYFIPEPEFSSYEPNYIPVNMGFAWVGWNSDSVIQSARILITTEGITQVERNHLIREELTQAISGCMQDSHHYPDSIFYQPWSRTTAYSQLDQDVIQLMYRSDIKPGMTREQIMQVFNGETDS